MDLAGRQPNGELRIGFRSGWLRSIALTVGGTAIIGLIFGAIDVAERQPEFFNLMARWGFTWLLALAAMLLLWDLAKIGLAHLGGLAASVQETAVALGRIADKDDRERDRMVTETAFVGARIEKLTEQMRADRAEQNAWSVRMESLLKNLAERKAI